MAHNMMSDRNAHIVDIIKDIMDKPCNLSLPAGLRRYSEFRMPGPAGAKHNTEFKMRGTRPDGVLRIRSDDGPRRIEMPATALRIADSVPLATAVKTESKTMPVLQLSLSRDQPRQMRYLRNCPACRKLKLLEKLQKLSLRPPCKQGAGVTKRSSRMKTSSHHKKRGAKRSSRSDRRKTREVRFLSDKRNSEERDESTSSETSMAGISSEEKLPSNCPSTADAEPMVS